jgi:hypothetical protein
VPNPSFETFTSCPTAGSQISFANPWQGVTTNSTDYYNSCSTTYDVPAQAGGGFQNAKTGNAYAAFWAVNGFGSNYREYLQVKLDSALQFDSCYVIEFYCNLYNQVDYGIDKMGAYISNTAVSSVGPGLVLQYIPQIISHTSLTDTVNWMRVSGYYHASGGEQYITIGNFSTDINTDTTYIQHGSYNGSYYLIDDVSITKAVACDTTLSVHENNNEALFNLFPNPSNGSMQLSYTLTQNEKGFFKVYDATGKLIREIILNSSGNSIQLGLNLDNGIYLYQIIVDDKIFKSDKLVIIKN